MLPTLRQLQYFKALAENRSFSKAAEVCNVTQSTLSAAIRQLEDILGSELVDRSGRVLLLTDVGEQVLGQATSLLRDAEDLVHGVKTRQKPLYGRFRLGVIPSIAPFLLPRFLPSLRESYPELKLYLREDITRNLVSGLREGRLDAVLLALPYDIKGFRKKLVGRDELLLALPQNHRLVAADTITLDDLRDEVLLLLEDGHCLRDHVLATITGGVANSSEELQATSMTTLVQMVDNGLGLTLIPQVAVESNVTSGTSICLSHIEGVEAMRDLCFVWRKHSSQEENARLMADLFSNFMTATSERGWVG
ncbi:hydrogen peroxide-inducible genes activator [Flexibacterium corallicola]|uniref:hydrogen peroxide-inducible genes activator n=1 Tax=Flexibacterium corallicola TaxID=3037259 RepID=UPI00286F2BD6|nr:hydrogen peroxide-inducible genes activator [Pseudovibrio sp. M1P-2-3]